MYGGESKGYKCCQTAHRGTAYKGPIQHTKPIVRCETPQNLGNLKDTPRNNDNKGLDFMNNATAEVVEEQLYSSNMLPDSKICTENEMSYEEWLVAQSLAGLKLASVEHQTEETLPGTVQVEVENINKTLDAMLEFLQQNIIPEAAQVQVIHKLHAIAECMNIKQLVVETEEGRTKSDFMLDEKSEGKKLDRNIVTEEDTAKEEDFVKEKKTEVKDFVKNKQIAVKSAKIEQEEEIHVGKSVEEEPKSLMKRKDDTKFIKKKNVSFAETVTPMTLKLEVDESEDNSNDTVLVIYEDDKIEHYEDDDDDIPLSQVQHGERMSRYRENKKDSDSDEFGSSSQEETEVQECLKVVTEIVEDLIKDLDKEEAVQGNVNDEHGINEAADIVSGHPSEAEGSETGETAQGALADLDVAETEKKQRMKSLHLHKF